MDIFLVRSIVVALMFFRVTLYAYAFQSESNENVPARDGVTVNWVNQKTSATQLFVRPDPAEYMKAINENRQILRAKIVLDSFPTIDLYEKPKDIDFYDSTVVVNRQGKSQIYNVGNLIKHQALSLAHAAIVPSGNEAGMLVFEYEGGAVGAREGFAILRFSRAGFELHTLPLTDFGKVVVFRSKPELVEIWTALNDYIGSDADRRFYATRACHLKADGYACEAPRRKRGRFYPADINDPGIEIRP